MPCHIVRFIEVSDPVPTTPAPGFLFRREPCRQTHLVGEAIEVRWVNLQHTNSLKILIRATNQTTGTRVDS